MQKWHTPNEKSKIPCPRTCPSPIPTHAETTYTDSLSLQKFGRVNPFRDQSMVQIDGRQPLDPEITCESSRIENAIIHIGNIADNADDFRLTLRNPRFLLQGPGDPLEFAVT